MKGCKKVYSNLLAQNVYVRDCCLNLDKPLDVPEPTYISLDEVITDKGVEIVEKVEEYPITPEYVDSFVAGSDYRNNLAEAVVQSANRAGSQTNLGDIRSVQDVLAKNPDVVNALYSQLLAKFRQKTPEETPEKTSAVEEK